MGPKTRRADRSETQGGPYTCITFIPFLRILINSRHFAKGSIPKDLTRKWEKVGNCG